MHVDLQRDVLPFGASGAASGTGPAVGTGADAPPATVEGAAVSAYRIAFGCSLEPSPAMPDAPERAGSREDRGTGRR